MRILSGGGPRSVRLTGIGDPQGIILPSALKRPLDRAGDVDRRARKEHLRGLPESWVGPSRSGRRRRRRRASARCRSGGIGDLAAIITRGV